MEPISTLAIAGIGWVATKTVDSITAGAVDRAYVAAVRAIRDRLPALAARPEGGDLARGVRRAQLRALEQVIRDYGRERPLARLGGGSDAFTQQALEFCRSAADQPVLIPHIKGDALLPLASLHAEVDGVAAGAAAMEGAVLAELAVALDGIPIPSGFAEHLRSGGRGTPRFVELFGIYFAEQVKTDDAFREVLHTGLLLQNAANLAALGDWLAQVEARFGGALARLESGVADLATENRAGFAAVLEALAAEKGVPAAALRSILEKLGETAVQDGDILARLSAKADEYVALREQLSALAKSTPIQARRCRREINVSTPVISTARAGSLPTRAPPFAPRANSTHATRRRCSRPRRASTVCSFAIWKPRIATKRRSGWWPRSILMRASTICAGAQACLRITVGSSAIMAL